VQEAQQGGLEDVAGVGPALHGGEAPEHLAGQALQPVAHGAEQVVAGGPVAAAHAVDPVI
jgi:hypothetical protein